MSDGSGNGSVGGGNGAAGVEPGRSPVETVREFVEAVVWGEHQKVWDLMGVEARTTVLEVASNRGMDEALAARLRDGTAAAAERDDFLVDLVNGLRADLEGNDFDALRYEEDPERPEPGRARVVIFVPAAFGPGGNLPVGSVELAAESSTTGEAEWRIERLVPQVSK
ncbi:MAG: hypothetical protein M3203_03875 [Actinomycetota bacterium]|nr:hypothetical protein [Actinomycetota bacterium]